MYKRQVRREPGRHVIGIGGRVVISEVARITGRRGPSVTVRVALQTRHVRVRSGEREARRVVVEGRRLPCTLIVAGRTVRREARTGMVRIRGRVEVRQVARITVRRRTRIPVAVALQAVHDRVRALQRERRRVVIERGVVPGTLIVAHRAVRREPGSHMVRIGRAVVVRQVTGIAVRGRSSVTVRVALQARHVRVRARQREARAVVVEGARLPSGFIVTGRTIQREAR